MRLPLAVALVAAVAAPDARAQVPPPPPSGVPSPVAPPDRPPLGAPPAGLPPPPESAPPPPGESQGASTAPVPEGQWVLTQQYGWVWIPYGDAYTQVPPGGSGEPLEYVYAPRSGWAWVVAPWVGGAGPWPDFGDRGPARFAWYRRSRARPAPERERDAARSGGAPEREGRRGPATLRGADRGEGRGGEARGRRERER